MPDADIERALVVVAHPDDLDFGAAGTIATWTAAGLEVSYCVLTDGDAGGFDPDVPRSEIGGIRQAEQRAAAKEVGVEDVVFLATPTGGWRRASSCGATSRGSSGSAARSAS